uniref:Putative homeodomain transcription factor 2 n=1 Tax=Phallusia mammillata TaxID=59560 RepID=A0A6F9DP79_9ASCI|nr:putative homeodomain transcription factor 2 [Phallusia mammillata]
MILDVWNKEKVSFITIILGTFIQRFVFSFVLFVMLCAAQRTYQKRLLFAKYFSHLTSSRCARKSHLPHFRLNKVQNIKIWLSLRSYLRRRGPQRSVDVIVSSAFCCSVCLLCFTTIQLMNSPETFMSSMLYWDCLVLLLALGIFLLHFITVGAKINKNYSNVSVILTEQMNLYFQMDKTPLKKEQLQLVNSVLTNATKLIKEIETPYSLYGLAMNPLLYNITRVIILSAFSGVMSEMLGFKLKVWKIKA